MYIKDGVVKTLRELRKAYPNVSFGLNTAETYGWQVYTPPLPEPKVYIPQSVSPFQAKVVLLLDNKLADVQGLVDVADAVTKLAWAEVTEFRRDSPTIAGVAQALGWTEEYLDSLFLRASQVKA